MKVTKYRGVWNRFYHWVNYKFFNRIQFCGEWFPIINWKDKS